MKTLGTQNLHSFVFYLKHFDGNSTYISCVYASSPLSRSLLLVISVIILYVLHVSLMPLVFTLHYITSVCLRSCQYVPSLLSSYENALVELLKTGVYCGKGVMVMCKFVEPVKDSGGVVNEYVLTLLIH